LRRSSGSRPVASTSRAPRRGRGGDRRGGHLEGPGRRPWRREGRSDGRAPRSAPRYSGTQARPGHHPGSRPVAWDRRLAVAGAEIAAVVTSKVRGAVGNAGSDQPVASTSRAPRRGRGGDRRGGRLEGPGADRDAGEVEAVSERQGARLATPALKHAPATIRGSRPVAWRPAPRRGRGEDPPSSPAPASVESPGAGRVRRSSGSRPVASTSRAPRRGRGGDRRGGHLEGPGRSR
jgi:hypothetical protein